MKTYFAIVGAMCILLALWLSVRRIRVLLFGNRAIGTVEGHERRESDDAISHHPTVAYTDASGKQQRFTSKAAGGKVATLGTPVPVRYLPSEPPIAYIAGFKHMWGAPVTLFVMGGMLTWAMWQ